ncbi:hypothetical protein PaG_03802 [Moesziomyces aphidis]|jgi:hypothetical protein|uniref:Chitin biosynthesis protein n=1 Tax=Moesziomyces aphidis TaxID=84754 RepID=W3VL54_MOEAP|nr:hypothetical protein PaG_03802 [Moesziomyces aphidis]
MSAHYVGQIAPNYVHSTMQANSDDDSFTFTVGKLDAGMAILIGEKASLIEFPSLLLPHGVSSGSVVNIRVMRNEQQERRQKDDFDLLQEDILHTFGQQAPKVPALRLRNVTQTSVTLEWERLSLATATLLSLDIYRNGQRLAPIPNPLHNTSTKLSGLDVNADYTFHLVMKTTAGTFSSPLIKTRTHTINDTSGISVCFGHVHDAEMLEAAKKALASMKAKWSDRIQIDTTHYICTDPRNPGDVHAQPSAHGNGYTKAMQLSIPAVLPHWIFACHDQKKMVGISPFYLDQDPPNAATIRQSIDQVLGKHSASAAEPTAATSAAAAPAQSSNASDAGPPPPPLEKDAKPVGSSAAESAPATEPAPATEIEHETQQEAAAAGSQAEASGSALGLKLNEDEPAPSPPQPQPQPPTPIITTSAPSDDGEDDEAPHASELPAPPPPPQVIVTPTEPEEAAADAQPKAEPASHEDESGGLNADAHADDDDDGDMDDVSLGGNTNADDENEVDEADTRLF